MWNYNTGCSHVLSYIIDNVSGIGIAALAELSLFSPLGIEGKSLPYYIQCKNSKNKPNYHELLTIMPQDRTPIVIHRQTHKANAKFITDGDYVIMKKSTFYNLIRKE